MSSADEPRRRLELLVAAPDAGPERIANRIPGPARLRGVGQDIRAGGHAPVGAGFLLQVREGEAERDGRIEFRPLEVLVLRREARLDGHERGHRDDREQHDRHHHERQHEAEAGAPATAQRLGVGGHGNSLGSPRACSSPDAFRYMKVM